MREIILHTYLLEEDAVRFSDQSVDMDADPSVKGLASLLFEAAFRFKGNRRDLDFLKPAPLYADQAFAIRDNPQLLSRLKSAISELEKAQ